MLHCLNGLRTRGPMFFLYSMQIDDTLFTGISSFLAGEEAQAYRFPIKTYFAVDQVPVQFKGSFLFKTNANLKASQKD